MRFVFIESFNLKFWNGELARTKKGISGTHSASMYLAEALAANSHEVCFVSLYDTMVETDYLGVKYVNYCNFETMECDYVVTTNNLNDFDVLNKIHHYQKIIIILNNDLSYHEKLFSFPKHKIVLAYLNQFSKTNIENVQPFLKEYSSFFLPNSIDLRDIQPIASPKENRFVFFACVDRGLQMTIEIVKNLPAEYDDFRIYSNTYADQHQYLTNTDNANKLIQTNGSSKNTIFGCLSKSKYFVYPLINLENNKIHYDTFGYVVLEALLHGVIVIAPRFAVYEELYGDAICYVDTDEIIPKEDLKYWKKQNPDFGHPMLSRYVNKIIILENNEDLRNEYIEKGLALANKFSNTTIYNTFMDFVTEMTPLKKHLLELANKDCLPTNHIQYLYKLKQEGFEPKVIYDIGSCVLHWTKYAKQIWPDAQIILFDAFEHAEFLYKDYQYYMGVLSNTDDNIVRFYQNDFFPGGNSYYREIGCEDGKYFPEDKYIEKTTKTLDSIIKERGFPLPDFIKIDVQGCEIDILMGGQQTIQSAKRMIVELQHTEYNRGALLNHQSLPIIEDMGWKCVAPLFQNNGCDGDYGFFNTKSSKTILTIFAGRQENLEILKLYLQKALEFKIIDEVHFWNNTRTEEDEVYLKTISNVKRTSSRDHGNYIHLVTPIRNNSFHLKVKAANDIHLKMIRNADNFEYEIILGGRNNTWSVVRTEREELAVLNKPIANPTRYSTISVSIDSQNHMTVTFNNQIVLECQVEDGYTIDRIYAKTGFGSVGKFEYETVQNHGFYLMDTCEKNWHNYYHNYADVEYHNDVILKCDDDILFIDLTKLPDFIDYIKNTDNDLVFANTINNGVSAYYQQNNCNLIPRDLMVLECPTGWGGSLWENGAKAELLHTHFIQNYTQFLDYNYHEEVIPITTRYSINFFGYKAKNWYKICDCGDDDERMLTIDYVQDRNFKNVLYTDMYVAHLSFYQQIASGINLSDLRIKYRKLFEDYMSSHVTVEEPSQPDNLQPDNLQPEYHERKLPILPNDNVLTGEPMLSSKPVKRVLGIKRRLGLSKSSAKSKWFSLSK